MYWRELNLSDWREQQQRLSIRRWSKALALCLLGIGSYTLLVTQWLELHWQPVEQELSHWRAQLNQIAAKPQKIKLTNTQLATAKQWHSQWSTLRQMQLQWPQALELIADTVPVDVYLESVETRLNKVQITGYASTSSALNHYLINLESHSLVAQVTLDKAVPNSRWQGQDMLKFWMQLHLTQPAEPNADD